MRCSISTLSTAGVVAWVIGAPLTAAQEPTAAQTLAALNQETRRQLNDSGLADFVWWLPTYWWRLSLGGNDTVPLSFLQRTETALSEYTLVLIAHSEAGPGSLTWAEEPELSLLVALRDQQGEEYPPIPTEQVSADARAAVDAIRPSFEGLLGPVGRNFHFFFFPAATESGTPLADPRSPGEFSVRVADERYDWRLPLGSLLPEKQCPVDGERLNGAWLFCPWHGERLVAPR